MSWLGSGLSQITGQISNFTKEVLTEGTEEVDDHATELRLAKSSVVDLEGQNIQQKAELERLRHVNEELLEKLHSSELQINKQSSEFRSTLQNKEDEVKRLKQEHNEILDMHGKLAVATEMVPSSHSRSHSASTLEDFGADQHDFDDIISSQHEINRLRLENQRLAAECRHWKNLANTQGAADAVSPGESGASLHQRIQDLESELNVARDRHQHELAELQDLHRQKLSTLKRQHKEELSQREQQQQQGNAASVESEVSRLREQLQTQQVELKEMSQLREQLQERELEKEQLSEEVEQLQEALMQFKTRSSPAKPMVQAQQDAGLLSTIPLNSASSSPQASPGKSPESLILDYSEEHMRVRQLEGELRSAEESIERLESEQSRLVADGEATRKQLEDVVRQLEVEKTKLVEDNRTHEASVAELREQLEQHSKRPDPSAGEVASVTAKLTECQTQLNSLTQDNTRLVTEHDTLKREKTAMQTEKTELEEELSNQKALLSAMEVKHQQQVTAVREEADGAATQLDQVNTQLAACRDELRVKSEHCKTLQQHLEQLESVTLQHAPEVSGQAECELQAAQLEEAARREQLQEEKVEELSQQLQEKVEALEDLQIEKEALEASLEELDTQHQEALNTVERLRKTVGQQGGDHHTQSLERQLREAQEETTGLRMKLEEEMALRQQLQKLEREAAVTLKLLQQQAASQREQLEEQTAGVRHWQDQCEHLKQQLLTVKQQMVADKEAAEQAAQTQFSQLQSQMEALQAEKLVLSGRLEGLSQSQKTELESKEGAYEEEVSSLKQELSGLQQSHRQLQEELSKQTQLVAWKEGEISRLEELRGRLEDRVEELDRELETQERIGTEAGALQEEFMSLTSQLAAAQKAEGEQAAALTALEQRLAGQQQLQQQLEAELREERENSGLAQQQLDESTSSLKQEVARAEDHVRELEGNLQEQEKNLEQLHRELVERKEKLELLDSQHSLLQEQLAEKDKKLELLDAERSSLERSKQEYERHNFSLQEALAQKDTELTATRQRLQKSSLSEKEQDESAAEPVLNGTSSHVSNGDVGAQEETGTGAPSLEDMEGLKRILTQKDDVITELRNNNGSLLKLLEERCLASHGNKVLLEVHKLESEVRGLRTEKEQIMAVLQEKTREASNLKTEVHRLMNVVTQSKAALAKMQDDNINSQQSRSNTTDMQKEAMQNLARIIRDKDMEIEALTQKNQTLLEVLQDSSNDGGHVATIVTERDNLRQQVQLYQTDRNQIVAALTAKHEESVAYHAEVQRLSAVKASEEQAREALQQEYNNLRNQYEDKTQALLKAQNELINYRQKYAEVDTRYKEMLTKQQQQKQQQLSGTEPLVTEPSSEEYEQLVARLQDSLEQQKAEVTELQRQCSKHKQELTDRQSAVQTLQSTLEERTGALSGLQSQLHSSQEETRKFQSELMTLRKQHETIQFTMAGQQSELTDLTESKERLLQQQEERQHRLDQLKDANSRLSVTIGERDLEVSSLRERVSTLQQVLAEKEGATEMSAAAAERLAESEAMQKQAQLFQQERDQAMASLQAKQAEVNTLLAQIETLTEREGKLSREVERLRSHLLTIEDGYTQEALAAEEREKELRTRLAQAEDRALSSSSAIQTASAAASEQVESLQEQLSVMAEQRDAAMMQLASAQETATQYATSLANLQMVLEQFTHEREHAQALEVEHSRQQMEAAITERNQLQDKLRGLQTELDSANEGLEAAHRLSEQLDRREEVIRALKEEVQLRENELTRSEEEIRLLKSVNEGRVEKALVRNLFLGYFHSPRGKREDVLRVIGKVLTFSQDEMNQIGLEAGGSGWLGGLFNYSGAKASGTSPKHGLDKSFSELFVKFLERESTPTPAMRLPAEQMVRDTQQRKEQRPKQAFNPFAAPIGGAAAAASHPLVAGQGNNALFSPILPGQGDTAGSLTTNMDTRGSPALLSASRTVPNPATRGSPGLTAGLPPSQPPSLLTSGSSNVYPPSGPSLMGPAEGAALPGGSSRGSTSNSGRSTPASSSVILSNVLQQ